MIADAEQIRALALKYSGKPAPAPQPDNYRNDQARKAKSQMLCAGNKVPRNPGRTHQDRNGLSLDHAAYMRVWRAERNILRYREGK